MANTLVINTGSSSVKFKLYNEEELLLAAAIDRIGEHARLEVRYSNIEGISARNVTAHDHRQAGMLIKQLLSDIPLGMTIHRIVHGGKYTRPQPATIETIAYLHTLIPLAPLHIPASLQIVGLFNECLAMLCFDTMFHSSLPAVAATYAIPQELAAKHHIRKTGFHGIAHQALAQAAASMLDKPLASLRIITCQLGNGASVCAIKNGRSIDTSMGFTPLEGLVMGTRSGDIDPAIIAFLCEHEHLTPKQVLDLLNKHSGLLALGGSNDVRELIIRDDDRSRLALQIYAYRVRKYIGAYMAALGGADVIVLGGGVAKSAPLRQLILSGLDDLGIVLDEETLRGDAPVQISSGRIPVLVLEADEEGQMYRLIEGYASDLE